MRNSKITLNKILTVINRSVNSVDNRFINHGEQVAYIMLKLLRQHGGYSNNEILNICSIAMFHDIGAYKVSERDKIIEIDCVKPLDHAIYGGLFIKYFSPLKKYFKVVLGHHFTIDDIKSRNIDKEAIILKMADYLSLVYLSGELKNWNCLEGMENEFLEENIKLFIEADKRYNIIDNLKSNNYIDELATFFKSKQLNREEIISYAKMLAYAIDFRSEATVRHTILVEAICGEIAELSGIDSSKIIRLKIAATLHDVGKIMIPVEILEKPGKLTTEEYEIIKGHAINGYNILSDLNIDDIRDIATLHHEKLDGTGYPFGLKGSEITKEVRIVAIADILSALLGIRSYKEEFNEDEIKNILLEMAKNDKIDYEITSLVVSNYKKIVKNAKEASNVLMSIYENMNFEYEKTLQYFQ